MDSVPPEQTQLPNKHGSFEIEKNGTFEAEMLGNFDGGSRTPLITASSTELLQTTSFRGKGVQTFQKLIPFTSSIKNQGPVVLKHFRIFENITHSGKPIVSASVTIEITTMSANFDDVMHKHVDILVLLNATGTEILKTSGLENFNFWKQGSRSFLVIDGGLFARS